MVAEEILSRLAGYVDPSRLGLFAVGCGFAVLAAAGLGLKARRSRAALSQLAKLQSENALLRADLDAAQSVIRLDAQIVVSWLSPNDAPELQGDADSFTRLIKCDQVLAFGHWLPHDQAQALDAAVDALKAKGEAFTLPLFTRERRYLDAHGRVEVGEQKSQ